MIPFKEKLLISGLFATLFPQLAAKNIQKIKNKKFNSLLCAVEFEKINKNKINYFFKI